MVWPSASKPGSMVVDEHRLLEVGRRYLVAVVAIAAAAESFFQSIAGVLDHRLDLFGLWTFAYLVILFLVWLAETVKIGEGE